MGVIRQEDVGRAIVVSRPVVAKRHNRIWFIVVFAVGLVVLFAIQSSQKAPKTLAIDEGLIRVEAPALQPMDASKVSQVELTLSGQHLVATKKDDRWVLETPFNDDADSEAIEAYHRDLQRAGFRRDRRSGRRGGVRT